MFRDAAASGSSVSDRRHLTCHDQTAMFKPKSTPSSTVLSKATDFAFAADAGFCGGADRRAVALSNHPNICLPTILFGGGAGGRSPLARRLLCGIDAASRRGHEFALKTDRRHDCCAMDSDLTKFRLEAPSAARQSNSGATAAQELENSERTSSSHRGIFKLNQMSAERVPLNISLDGTGHDHSRVSTES